MPVAPVVLWVMMTGDTVLRQRVGLGFDRNCGVVRQNGDLKCCVGADSQVTPLKVDAVILSISGGNCQSCRRIISR